MGVRREVSPKQFDTIVRMIALHEVRGYDPATAVLRACAIACVVPPRPFEVVDLVVRWDW